MGQTAQHLVSDLLGLLPFAQGLDLTPEVGRILNSKKVSDHHAIIPTAEFVKQASLVLPRVNVADESCLRQAALRRGCTP